MSDLFPLAVAPIERFMLIDERPDYPQTFYIGFLLDGMVNFDHLRETVREAVADHPLLTARLEKTGAEWHWIAGSPEAVPVDIVPHSPHPVPPRGAYIDVTTEPGLRVFASTNGKESQVWLQLHHACTDGHGSRFLCRAIGVGLARRSSDVEPQCIELDPNLLRTRDRLPPSTVAEEWTPRQQLHGSLGFLFLKPDRVSGERDRPAVPVPKGQPVLAYRELGADLLPALKRKARRNEHRVNDVMTALMFLTLDSWNRRQGKSSKHLRLMLPMSARAATEQKMPGGNQFGYGFLTRSGRQLADHDSLLKGVGEELAFLKRTRGDLDFVHTVSAVSKRPLLMKGLIRVLGRFATAVFSNIGDTRLFVRYGFEWSQDGRCSYGETYLRGVVAMSPIRSGTRVAITTCPMGDRLVIAIQCDPKYFDHASATQLLTEYTDGLGQWALDEATPSESTGVRKSA